MPMKAMIYKTLSTVVDDFFAYGIYIIIVLNGIITSQQLLHQDAILAPSSMLPVCSSRLGRSR